MPERLAQYINISMYSFEFLAENDAEAKSDAPEPHKGAVEFVVHINRVDENSAHRYLSRSRFEPEIPRSRNTFMIFKLMIEKLVFKDKRVASWRVPRLAAIVSITEVIYSNY